MNDPKGHDRAKELSLDETVSVPPVHFQDFLQVAINRAARTKHHNSSAHITCTGDIQAFITLLSSSSITISTYAKLHLRYWLKVLHFTRSPQRRPQFRLFLYSNIAGTCPRYQATRRIPQDVCTANTLPNDSISYGISQKFTHANTGNRMWSTCVETKVGEK